MSREPTGPIASVIAYWAPLLHLLHFGLGWARPDRGLARWVQLGRPTDDPVLRVVDRWWGDRMPDFLAWAADTDILRTLPGLTAAAGHAKPISSAPVPDLYPERRRDPAWQATWSGGSDTLHLTSHLQATTSHADPPPPALLLGPSPDPADPTRPRMALVVDQYQGWHDALRHHPQPIAPNGRSVRVDVICRPIGWLGEYRQSRHTGLWFRGAHRWHTLGI